MGSSLSYFSKGQQIIGWWYLVKKKTFETLTFFIITVLIFFLVESLDVQVNIFTGFAFGATCGGIVTAIINKTWEKISPEIEGKEPNYANHGMFANLKYLQTKRTAKQALGFYIVFFIILVSITSISGGIIGILFYLLSLGTLAQMSQTVRVIASIIAIIIVALLGLLSLRCKKSFNHSVQLALVVIGIALAILFGGMLGLIPIAYLTTKRDYSGTDPKESDVNVSGPGSSASIVDTNNITTNPSEGNQSPAKTPSSKIE